MSKGRSISFHNGPARKLLDLYFLAPRESIVTALQHVDMMKSSRPDTFKKLHSVLIKKLIDWDIINTLMEDMPDNITLAIRYKYAEGYTDTAISIKLHLHPMTLRQWQEKFLQDIYSLTSFIIPESHIFSLQLVNSVSQGLDTYLTAISIPPESLLKQQSQLHIMKKRLTMAWTGTGATIPCPNIIRLRIADNYAPLKKLANLAGYSPASASRKISEFKKTLLSPCE